ncbi:MAG: hypothetical protein M1834_003745 [Cirrosporium novae-zelandiae]|nr:MAG: hypothetical protein M1834_003745 [Cirrosporium novae-zelandiae]
MSFCQSQDDNTTTEPTTYITLHQNTAHPKTSGLDYQVGPAILASLVTEGIAGVVGLVKRGFDYLFDKKWREDFPAVTRWFETVYNQPLYSSSVPPFKFIDEAIKYTPLKNEKKHEEKKKEQPKPKKGEEE